MPVERRGGGGIHVVYVCGAEMRLVKVEQDDSMMVTGYEHHTFECSSCQEVERRLIFTQEPTPHPGKPLPVAPVLSPATKEQNEAAPPTSSVSTDEIAPPVSPGSTDQAPPMSPVSTADTAPPTSLASRGRNEAVVPSRWTRAVAKLRGRQRGS